MTEPAIVDWIEITGARVHNLKNIDLKIPRSKLVVFTGLSGSGKSSLAFDTIYAEGQRRYIETFGSYARQFLGSLERPDVDKIEGLSPVISIEQKTVSKNPRSTVGTITEVYDFLRLLYARASDAYSYNTGEKMVRYSEQEIVNLILDIYKKNRILVLAPVVKGRKGHYRELFEQWRKKGFTKVRVDGELLDLNQRIQLDRYRIHDIEIVIDRLEVGEKIKRRLAQAVELGMKHGKGEVVILDYETNDIRFFSKNLMCPTTGISYNEPAPNLFSFNSPYGACPRCNGLGKVSEIDRKKIIPDDSKSIKSGGLKPLGDFKANWFTQQIEAILNTYGFDITTPLRDIDEDVINIILNGTESLIQIREKGGGEITTSFEGIVNFILRHAEDNPSRPVQRWAGQFMNRITCPECEGARLRKEALFFMVDGLNISQLAEMDIDQLGNWFENLETRLDDRQNKIAREVLKEIRSRVGFLLDVGLNYLSLNRSSRSLSGGEAQRIRLATQIGSELTGVMYILDEPSIGLHQRDNDRLIGSLKKLRDSGNSVLVVEHDRDMIERSDYVVDIGPRAGKEGGRIVEHGSPGSLKDSDSLTSRYLRGSLSIPVPKERRPVDKKKMIVLKGATGHNLKKVTLELPLGVFVCVAGVSGSGKSSLINQTLYPHLQQKLHKGKKKPLPFKSISGLKNIDKVIDIDQSPIGRTPRSNPATYTGVFSDIRNLFTQLPEAKIRGYKPGRFSFNVKGGRCETCKGAGVRTIEMNFLPDVYVECETCQGKRYNRETLEVRYKGKSISDVLDMSISEALEFFENIPKIRRKIETMHSVGLGYLTLGQQSTTLSGGEAQRVKLSTELSKRGTGKTLYILDEPTTGLHFEDIRMLLDVLQRLVKSGNTVLVIEHNLDIIKVADHLIDLGPDGGRYGGEIVATGTPEEVAKNKKSITGKYLMVELDGKK